MNIAFIDAQNLHLGTTKCIQCSEENDIPFSTLNVSDCKCGNAWRVDFFKFQEYLDKKPHQFITINEFSEYSGIEIDIINLYIN